MVPQMPRIQQPVHIFPAPPAEFRGTSEHHPTAAIQTKVLLQDCLIKCSNVIHDAIIKNCHRNTVRQYIAQRHLPLNRDLAKQFIQIITHNLQSLFAKPTQIAPTPYFPQRVIDDGFPFLQRRGIDSPDNSYPGRIAQFSAEADS